MCDSCVHLASGVKDPTETTILRNQFAAKMGKRYGLLNQNTKKSIVKNDCFGIKKGVSLQEIDSSIDRAIIPAPLVEDSLSQGNEVEQTEAFMAWVENQERSIILQHAYGISGLASYWFSPYIKTAYKKGMIWARANLKREYRADKQSDKARNIKTDPSDINSGMESQTVVDQLNMLWTRSLTGLEGINDATNVEIRRVLLDGLSFGWSPLKISQEISSRISDIGTYRAKLLARTEIIKAHHMASINEYRQAGIVGVKVMAEFTTARDSRVCPICADLDFKRTGKLWPLDEIESIIPVHPNCRCAALPSV